jgi:fructose-specific phosphotransferase system IIC component
MFYLRKTYDLAVCLTGYWSGLKLGGGWGSGILVAFAGLVLSSYVWEWLAHNVLAPEQTPSAQKNFIFGLLSSLFVAATSYYYWGKY